MRKYWKLIATTTVIVLSIGTYYVNSTLSAESHPQFVIQTISGNAEEVKPLVLEGSYTDTSSMNYASTNLTITSEGSTYNSRSFINQIIGRPPTVIKDFQEKYRTFMRGKDPFVNWFFENEQFLAYATVDYKTGLLRSRDFNFEISVLNKEDGNIDSFMLEVPEGGELEHIFVDDVQMVEDELYLITRNMMRNHDDFTDEEHIYTIDIANQKVSNHEAITPYGQSDNYINVQLIETSPTKANEHLIIVKTELKVIEDAESTREEVINQEIISYNLATKEKEIITVPELRLDENQLSFFDGSSIYFTRLEGQEVVVTPYSLVDKHVGKSYSIQLSGEDGHVGGQMTTINDGKLYIASSQMIPNLNIDADVVVADADTGETLFRGQITLEDSSKETGQFDLNLHEIYMK
jgi:hypothetical protein